VMSMNISVTEKIFVSKNLRGSAGYCADYVTLHKILNTKKISM
jgi:hypothetical protein